MKVLTVNAGSSSLKLRLLGSDNRLLAAKDFPVLQGTIDTAPIAAAVTRYGRIDAVGHRVVHGGRDFTGPVEITPEVENRIRALTSLAPLHQPKSLAGIDALRHALPTVRTVACFDTAFHARMPAAAATYAVPSQWRDDHGVHRYGFHGLSHAYVTRRTAGILGSDPGRLVICHLGAGASLAAVRGGLSMDTTMGFTPLEGLVMSTRSGSVDPGLPLWLHRQARIPADEIADALEHRSGLTALAGTGDMREILLAAAASQPDARLAIDVYVHRLLAGIAAMATAVGGLDTLVFTGGVGENAPQIRAKACEGLAFLGLGIDAERNAAARNDIEITAAESRVRAFVLATREDLQIATEVRHVLTDEAPS